MDLATQTQLTNLRDSLTLSLLELRAGLFVAEQAQRELTGSSAHDVADRNDEPAPPSMSDRGEPVPVQRLQMQPAAPRSAPYQAAFEHARNRPSPRRASP